MTGRPAGAPGPGFALVATGPLFRRLAVSGEIDLVTAPDLERFLLRQLACTWPGATVVVDLSCVECGHPR